MDGVLHFSTPLRNMIFIKYNMGIFVFNWDLPCYIGGSLNIHLDEQITAYFQSYHLYSTDDLGKMNNCLITKN